MRVKDLTKFIIAREAVRVAKENGKPRPWTKDPILDKYRFCNVHREDDAVTRWLRANWYDRFQDDVDVWFAAVVARLLNNRVAMDKVDYLVEQVLGPLWADRKKLRPFKGRTLAEYQALLMSYDGLGSFIAAQIIADLKEMEPLKSAKDYWTFAASGPGSRRGLNRVLNQAPNTPWNEKAWREMLALLQQEIKPLELHAQDLQNCLCEFDKYERARLCEGTPKQIYKEKSNG
jgi:hypothetical protein